MRQRMMSLMNRTLHLFMFEAVLDLAFYVISDRILFL